MKKPMSGCAAAFLGAFVGGFLGMGLIAWIAPMKDADPDTASFGALFDGGLPGAAIGAVVAIVSVKRRR